MNVGTSISSGLIAATAGTSVGNAGKSVLSGVVAVSDGTNTATVIVYESASGATGKVLAVVTATVAQGVQSLFFNTPIRSDLGLVVAVTGTGTPQGIVYYGA